MESSGCFFGVEWEQCEVRESGGREGGGYLYLERVTGKRNKDT